MLRFYEFLSKSDEAPTQSIEEMINLKRTTSTDQDFIYLVKLLDADLAIRDGEEHAFYAQFNKIESIKYAVVACDNDKPVGCGAIKLFSEGTMEVKRMYVKEGSRGKGIAKQILSVLEDWCLELGIKNCILETGNKNQPEAVALYHKQGYKVIDNYGQYAGVEGSVCFGKAL